MTETSNEQEDAEQKTAQIEKNRFEPTPPVPAGMSKNAWKRQLKKEKHDEQRDEWVAARREKRKQQKIKRRSKEKQVKQDKKYLPGDEVPKPVLVNQEPSGVGVFIDCSFDSMMKEGEVISLSQQVIRCYAENKRAVRPVDLHIYGVDGELRKRFEGPIRNQHLTWEKSKPKRISFHHETYELQDSQDLVYLSSDSDNVVTTLEAGKTYIIGGIVDKGRYKNLCNNKAKEQGIVTGRLPIDEYIKISGRKVLTCNHVFEILLKFLEVGNWKVAFETILPMRKVGVKGNDGEVQSEEKKEEVDEEEEEEEEDVEEEEVEEEKEVEENKEEENGETEYKD